MTDRLQKKLRDVFADPAVRANAEATLLAFVTSNSSVLEPERVALAILKLSDGDAAQLPRLIEAANTDYRDVLAWAFYPEQLALGPNADEKAIRAARKRDHDQSLRWLGDE